MMSPEETTRSPITKEEIESSKAAALTDAAKSRQYVIRLRLLHKTTERFSTSGTGSKKGDHAGSEIC